MHGTHLSGPRLALASLASLALVSAACGGSEGTDPTPVTQPPVTAAPAPSPSPTPAAFRCPLPDMPRLNIICPRPPAVLTRQVDTAIDLTVQQHPELFNFNDERGAGGYLVLDRARYHQSVVDNLHAMGVCAIIETEEIAVKTTNEYNEQYNIWVSDGHVRRGPGAHITTCFPATF
jgi:hypothetical protein